MLRFSVPSAVRILRTPIGTGEEAMTNWKIPIVCGVIAVAGAIGWFTQGSADALPYHTNWGKALSEARETGKPILIHFGGPW